MAVLNVQQISLTGLNPTYSAAAAGGDKLAPGVHNFLHVKNGGGSSITVTIDSVTQTNFGTDADVVVSVPNGGERMIGPFSEGRFASSVDGLVSVAYSGVTTVTVAALRV